MYRYIKMIHSYDVKLMMSNLPASHFQFSGGRSFAPVAGSGPVILQFFSAGVGPFLPRTFDSTNKNIKQFNKSEQSYKLGHHLINEKTSSYKCTGTWIYPPWLNISVVSLV